jgi:RimJ/RimL family protein N-acetyltransferase
MIGGEHAPLQRETTPVAEGLLVITDDIQPVHTLQPQEMPLLAASLGDSPETVIAHHLLTARTCNAWCVGDVRQPVAAIIQAHDFLAEPIVFGHSPEDIARIMAFVEGWHTFSVPRHLVRALERPVATLGNTTSLNTLEDVHHILDGPLAATPRRDDVRLLTDDDILLTAGMPQLEQSSAYKPIVAAGIVEGEIVAIAHTFAWSPLYVDIGVSTHEAFRNQGYATSAAALVIEEVRKRGRTPVWSCGAENVPSIRIADKLGFREISRRTYLIPVEHDHTHQHLDD